ncbi:TIGR02302 family protein [Alsobacter sp. KACC 23698]|uniref:TIGR02302 family protein n=1 Tax=Alsobacter sp. KACC 23698 TaxID=3149229 RepID=A0AAU7JCX0_9HYPH
MSEDAQGVTPASQAERARLVAARVARLARRASLTLAWERSWPWLALALTAAALFVALSWLGLWLATPSWARVVGVALLGLVLGAAAVGALRAPRPTWRESLARLDSDSRLAHRPATALADELAINTSDPGTRALWEAHRARILDSAERLTVGAPAPRLADRDPWAVRFGVALALVAAYFVAGPEREARLMAAFDWSGRNAQQVAFRLDGWIDPPGYTQFPPMLLDLKAGPDGAAPAPKVRAPVRSTLVVRASDAHDLTLSASGGLEVPKDPADAPATAAAPVRPAAPAAAGKPAPGAVKANAPGDKPADASRESRWTVTGDGLLTVKRGGATLASIAITSIPDRPPSIELTAEPQTAERGGFTIPYEIKDDYGVVSAEARFGKLIRGGKAVEPKRPPLVPAPQAALTLPGGDNREGETRTTVDLSDHPWAGARVEMTLVAKDEIGQEGHSTPINVTLPQRPFSKPLAKALVEQRRDLILDPAGRRRVYDALQALMIAPEQFTPDASVYLGLRTAATRLRVARADADLISVADLLWEMALQVEDGDVTDAEKALRQAQENLKNALDKGATEQELKRLTQELRQALDRYLREYAEQMLKNRDPNQQQSRMDPNTRMITPRDLKSMLDRMEEMARKGDMESAQRMLDQLKNILENLKTARPGQRQMDQGQQQMEQALDDLDKMTREQQELRDKTFREGQRQRDARRGDGQKPQQGQRQRGQQQGQKGQKGQKGQPGQQGEPGDQGDGDEQGDQMGQGDGDQEGMEGLGQRQQALRQQLRELQRRMRENGMNGEQGLADAEDAMRQAEESMGRGEDGPAVDQQGRALEGLRRGAQGMAQQMQQGDGSQQAEGDPNGPGQPGNRRAQSSEPNDDPLGRPTPTTEAGDRSKFRRGGKGGTLEQRAREVMEELRRRLGDPNRPQDELDYLQRLLPVN